MGISNRDPPLLRSTLGGQRIDGVADVWPEHVADLHAGFRDRAVYDRVYVLDECGCVSLAEGGGSQQTITIKHNQHNRQTTNELLLDGLDGYFFRC